MPLTIAMLSYREFSSHARGGWNEEGGNRVFVIQDRGMPDIGETSANDVRQRTDVLPWQQLTDVLPELDKIVLYVGASGSEHVIELAARHKLPADRMVFVFCDCNMVKKRKALADFGFSSSEVMFSECGGRQRMRSIFRAALQGRDRLV